MSTISMPQTKIKETSVQLLNEPYLYNGSVGEAITPTLAKDDYRTILKKASFFESQSTDIA